MLKSPEAVAAQIVWLMRNRGHTVMTMDYKSFSANTNTKVLKRARRDMITAELLKRSTVVGWGKNAILFALDRNFVSWAQPPGTFSSRAEPPPAPKNYPTELPDWLRQDQAETPPDPENLPTRLPSFLKREQA